MQVFAGRFETERTYVMVKPDGVQRGLVSNTPMSLSPIHSPPWVKTSLCPSYAAAAASTLHLPSTRQTLPRVTEGTYHGRAGREHGDRPTSHRREVTDTIYMYIIELIVRVFTSGVCQTVKVEVAKSAALWT